jgi:hypothetical protein
MVHDIGTTCYIHAASLKDLGVRPKNLDEYPNGWLPVVIMGRTGTFVYKVEAYKGYIFEAKYA